MTHTFKVLAFLGLALTQILAKDTSAQKANYQAWPSTLPQVVVPKFKSDTVSITKNGALNDGLTLNTESINRTIDQVSKNGGGVVLIPRGFWLTGPIELKSNVNLHLAADAFVSFTDDLTQYRLIETNWEGLAAVRNQSPVSGTNLENIAITGKGIIDGNGDAWRMVKKEKLTDSQWNKLLASGGTLSEDKKIWYPSESSLRGSKVKGAGVISAGKSLKDYEEIKDFLRPNLLVLTNCKKVLLEGVTFQNSPAWNLHPLMCEDLTVRDLQVKNPWYAQNGDGIDVESCKNVLIENSVFDVGDDGICIKSGRDEQGRKRGKPTENVMIRNCVVYHAHGGFVIGSEMSGGAKNIYVSDCTFIGTDIGLRFKTTRGRGGVVENIFIKNINMKDIPGEAILFDMYYAAVDPVPLTGEKRDAPKVVLLPVTEETPQFKNFYINNVVADGADKAIFVRGLPEMNINNLFLEDITIQSKEGIKIEEAKDIYLKNVKVVTSHSKPMVNISNSTDISFDQLSYKPGAEVLFNVNGQKSANIQVANTNTSDAKVVSELNQQASKKALKIKANKTK
ncbi:glycoside hydrolase family 28 protein [Desertivirga xinjiangensis]|uniref:glycoside hydrolase family 28 protein n=1 Tax=Desertivirga xinjiangensis TaxID=539206 RepID=UPI00210B2E02|nr:glycoside hydrolase family 28 protein [Pedobacter xinjiangensis]